MMQPPVVQATWFNGQRLALRRDPAAFFYQIARQHGDVVSVHAGPRTWMLLNHPDLIEEVLVTHAAHFAAEPLPGEVELPTQEPLPQQWLAQRPEVTARLQAATTHAACALWTLTEALRLDPPVRVLGRRALSAVTVGGYTLDAGTAIVISPWVMHHDPRYFPDPFRFDALRWTPEAQAARPPWTYFPFGLTPLNTATVIAALARSGGE